MSSRLFRILVLAIGLAILWLVAGWYFSDEQRIHRRLLRIQRLVAKTPAESDLASLAAARAISEMFAEPFEARASPEDYSTSDRRTLVSGIHQYRSRTSTLVMEISQEQVFMEAGGGGANVFFTARFIADLEDLRTADQFDVRMHWVELDGNWLIDHVTLTSGS